jgi:membrane protease YdiL (CAAX protease family)
MALVESEPSAARDLSTALAVVGLVVGGEYFFRHYVMFWFPTLGTLRVNDMVSSLLFYSLLIAGIGALVHANWRDELAGVGQAMRGGLTSWSFTIWFSVLVVSVVILPTLDRLLWGRLELPMLTSSYQNSMVWFAGSASALKAVSLILVNGLFIPVAEEYLWRGQIQVRLARAIAPPFAIALTAVLFSLKHVLVDASMGRFLTLIAFGAVCGIVARRSSWRSSAALHVSVNTVGTVMALILGAG